MTQCTAKLAQIDMEFLKCSHWNQVHTLTLLHAHANAQLKDWDSSMKGYTIHTCVDPSTADKRLYIRQVTTVCVYRKNA